MRVLIAGATGYIGRALTRSLTAAGPEVVGLSRYPLGAAHTLPVLVAAHGRAPPERGTRPGRARARGGARSPR